MTRLRIILGYPTPPRNQAVVAAKIGPALPVTVSEDGAVATGQGVAAVVDARRLTVMKAAGAKQRNAWLHHEALAGWEVATLG